MIFEFNDNANYKEVLIKNGNKCLQILYAFNGDLYFDIKEKGTRIAETQQLNFLIDKEEQIYKLFLNLINNIKNCNVYNVSKSELMFCETEEDRKKLLIQQKVMNEELKQSEIHKKLVNNNCITWFSDESIDEKANKLELETVEDNIILTFTKNLEDETMGLGIRICNSGSKSSPFNLCFMEFFRNMQNLNSIDVDNESLTL